MMNAWHLGISPSKLLISPDLWRFTANIHRETLVFPIEHDGILMSTAIQLEPSNWTFQVGYLNQDPGSAYSWHMLRHTHKSWNNSHNTCVYIYVIYNIYLFDFIYIVTYTCIIMYLRHTIHTILKISSISMDVLTVQCDLMWFKKCALGWGLL